MALVCRHSHSTHNSHKILWDSRADHMQRKNTFTYFHFNSSHFIHQARQKKRLTEAKSKIQEAWFRFGFYSFMNLGAWPYPWFPRSICALKPGCSWQMSWCCCCSICDELLFSQLLRSLPSELPVWLPFCASEREKDRKRERQGRTWDLSSWLSFWSLCNQASRHLSPRHANDKSSVPQNPQEEAT